MTTEIKPKAAEFTLKIGGAPVDFINEVFAVEVENNLHLPDAFTIKVHLDSAGDKPFEQVDRFMGEFLSRGREVEIAHRRNREEHVVLSGEITWFGLDLSATMPGGPIAAVIRGYDKAHRLHRGRYARTFNQQSYSDIASKVIKEAGLQANVDATSGVHDYVIQCNQTNWEFLWQLAHRIGYEVYMANGALCFKKPRGGAAAVTLDWGISLAQFRLGASTAFQSSEVTVRSWDRKQKTAIVGSATSGQGSPKIDDTRSGSSQAQSAFGQANMVVVDQPVNAQAEAGAVAQSLADAIAGDFIVAEGVTVVGMPQILPGVTVKIQSVGERLSGEYYVTSTTHRFNREEGFSTSFVVSGRRPYTLRDMLDSDSASGHQPYGGGVVVGLVTDNKDPDDLGRVKVKFPWLGDQVESDWARIAAPGAGRERGMFWLPEVNDEVLVTFEHGDAHRPYILGGLWSTPDKPPAKNSEVTDRGKVNQRTIRSRTGHVIVLDDTQNAGKIIIRDQTEKNEIIIDSQENTLSVNIDKDITIKAAGKVTVESTQDMTLKSSANLNIQATGNISLEATGNLSAKGAQATLEGTAQAAVKAPMTSVEGSATTEVKGGIVRIN